MNHILSGPEGTFRVILPPNVPASFCKRGSREEKPLVQGDGGLSGVWHLERRLSQQTDRQRPGKGHIIEGKWHAPRTGYKCQKV